MSTETIKQSKTKYIKFPIRYSSVESEYKIDYKRVNIVQNKTTINGQKKKKTLS